jgi:hypothetical protein
MELESILFFFHQMTINRDAKIETMMDYVSNTFSNHVRHDFILQDTSEMNNIDYQSNKFDYNHISLKTSVCITKSLSIIQI